MKINALVCYADGRQEIEERDYELLPEPVELPTAQDDTDAMLIDHEYRLTLLELGVTEEV